MVSRKRISFLLCLFPILLKQNFQRKDTWHLSKYSKDFSSLFITTFAGEKKILVLTEFWLVLKKNSVKNE